MTDKITIRLDRINRSELWLAIIAFVMFLLGNYVAMQSEDFGSGRTLLELAIFFKAVSLFFGGFVVAVFAAPHMYAHGDENTVRDTVYIYGFRYAVACVFLAVLM